MYRLRKFPSRVGQIGLPLPDPFKSFALNYIQFRRGATSMIAGAPGSFKSVLALNMAAYWACEGLTGMYFSADSDELTVSKRVAGILSGEPVNAIEAAIVNGERSRYQDILSRMDGFAFEYAQMDMEGIATRLRSFEAVYGTYPDVVFLDNLIDFVESPDDWGGMLQLIKDLDALARDTRSHIAILHHAKLRGGGDSKSKSGPVAGRPPADWEIQGRVTQLPRLVLTMAEDDMNIRLACVKNTNGPQHRGADVWMDFQILTSMAVQDSDFMMGRALCALAISARD